MPISADLRWQPRLSAPRSLVEVAAAVGAVSTPPDLLITGISQDSRLVQPGHLYVALPGARAHGADFVPQALARGAVAMLSDRGHDGLPVLRVADPRAAVGPLAAWFYADPSGGMDVYGVTGTNGKSSTTYLIAAGLAGARRRTALLSGVVQRLPAGERPSVLTTPEASELQQLLAAAREQGADAAAVEVSSHGLARNRVTGTVFRVGVFTNLGRDHLDLHGDMASYLAVKASLFDPGRCRLAVIGVGDDAGRQLSRRVRVPVVTFSGARGAHGGHGAGAPRADWWAEGVVADAVSTSFRLRGPGTDMAVQLRLLGAHQVDNAVGAIAALASGGVDVAAAVRGMEALPEVPGRLERVDVGQPFLALVDQVHNTSGQERLLPWLRSLTRGRLHLVVGATGGRDPGKRRPLGLLAGVHADTVVVTDESAHDDDPVELREAVADGARAAGGGTVVVEADRGRAIDLAVARARPGDVVVVAGRGTAAALVSGESRVAFDDRAVLREALRRRMTAGAWRAAGAA